MNRIELEDNGFPFRAQTVRFLQDSYASAVNGIAKAICKERGSDYVIIDGVEQVGTKLTSGTILFNGEVVPFEESSNNAYIQVVETVRSETYKSGLLLPAYFTRVARTTQAYVPGTYPLSSFKRINVQPPAETDWQSVIFKNGYDEKSTIGSFARVDETGKGLIFVSYERTDGAFFDGNYDESTNLLVGRKVPIVQLPFKPKKRQTIALSSGFGYVDTDGIVYLDFRVKGGSLWAYYEGKIHAAIDLV